MPVARLTDRLPDHRPAMDALLADTLALDLEITMRGGALRHIGATFRGETFQWAGRAAAAGKALADLDLFGRRARFLLGHNLVNHDLPFLQAAAPGLELLARPVIDTLFLSPLAFPRNPYHRLVKDYKLVRSALSDPLEDVRLALSVFADQWESLGRQGVACPALLAFYAHCFRQSRFNGFGGHGLAAVLDCLGARPLPADPPVQALFAQLAGADICRHGIDPAFAALGQAAGTPAAAYALAWLRVAGTNSVLPPWVRRQFPAVVPFLKALRETPCGDPACTWCRAAHDPDTQLQRFFGFDAFRPTPASPDGQSLQRAVVLTGMQENPLLAILPTGGGKSLCYQLPALVRHMRRGLLTVVFSPLQALMKDQVDNLVANTGTPFAAAIYGLLTPPERGEVIERVRLGDIAVLYISPEQLRSRSVRRVLTQREIGCWVFDEAHCLSKWGHDFRPDYLYAGRFIRELTREQDLTLPPIACFTATAKPDVIEEIANYFRTELHQELRLFEGGVERDNLSFDVIPVDAAEKQEQTYALIRQHLGDSGPGSAIVYTATQKGAETVRDYLVHKGLLAEAFHGGLQPHEKRRIIEAFVAGEIAVICATNAFGMGIDKSDIRLVLHYEIPGSLENYLQEAGRAGRDRQPAHCILFYNPADPETQFKLGAYSEIQRDEIQRILRCLKRSKRNRDNEIVITTGELLRDEELAQVFDKEDRGADTKVRTAVSWLERADFLERNQNLTQVFQGKPLIKHLADADPIIDRLNLSPDMQALWRGILAVLFNTPADQSLSADDIAEQLHGDAGRLRTLERITGLTPAQVVIHAMHEMATARLLDKGMGLTAFIHCAGRKAATRLLATVADLETRLIQQMQEEAPDADAETETGAWQELDISRLNQRLTGDGHESNPVTLRLLIKGLARDGQGLAGSHGSIDLQHIGRSRYRVALRRGWSALSETATLRRDVAELIVRVLTEKSQQALAKAGRSTTTEVLIDFTAAELEAAIRHDLLLHTKVQKPLAAIDRALMFLHEHKIITLQQGLTVFRQAMTIRLNPHERRRQYTGGDFKPLAMHYRERRFQVHVIVEYATLAMAQLARALTLVLDYFALPRDGFVRKYFADRETLLERATSADAYRQIVDHLDNPRQIAVVGAPISASRLILAGPGAGKTRVVVHRCAYLLRVERIPARRILVMCFNHNAAVALRKRLTALVGRDARGVMVATYHGAAMRLAGISPRELMEGRPAASMDFDRLIRDAVALLKGEKEVPGLDPDELRDHLLQGFSHILVDEYQDIDQDQFELVSAIAGRTLEEGNGRLAILAVGDDDQNIYAFRGANIAFIQRFQQDYRCKTAHLVENYRSSTHIIQAANQLIARNRDRMKTDHPIQIDRRRRTDPPGGPWTRRDPVAQGRVQRLRVPTPGHQAAAVLQEIQRLRTLHPAATWDHFAILARTKTTLNTLRAHLERHHVPLRRTLETGLPLHRIREVHTFLSRLKAIEPEIRRASALAAHLPAPPPDGPATPWAELLADLLALYQEESADAEQPVGRCIDWLYDALAEQRREKALGRGLFLSTVHGAKGLEFDHVFIPDGDWHHPPARAKQEEERRLLYVGMTRAKETLCLMETATQPNPYIADLQGNWMIRRVASPDSRNSPTGIHRQYTLLSLSDLYLGHAGRFAADHPIHRRLAHLNAGNTLHLTATGAGIDLETPDGHCVAKMSKEGSAKWAEYLPTIREARIIGMVRWCADDGHPDYRHYCKVSEWEVPLVELIVETEC
ncbi:MAG: RecQ family ATP-dependent DNA helicase [Desulfatitalea sp.]|nr:RecQ family ATP-dependent DNA helicase [Desulfatitalea sp.]